MSDKNEIITDKVRSKGYQRVFILYLNEKGSMTLIPSMV